MTPISWRSLENLNFTAMVQSGAQQGPTKAKPAPKPKPAASHPAS